MSMLFHRRGFCGLSSAVRYTTNGKYPVTLLHPPRISAWRLHGIRQLRSGSCCFSSAADKCTVQTSQATDTSSVEKQGGFMRYIPNTYSLQKVSSFYFAYNYCLNTIFQKLHFSKSHFSETPQEKYDHVIFLQPKSLKKCRKKFENRFTSKMIMPKKYLE